MTTPVYDFVSEYLKRSPVRLHMPGHKGTGPLGCEARDLTEIPGADLLSAPEGILLESENNASLLFGTAHTFYSTEGSSQCIRAMLSMVAFRARSEDRRILATRNAHKTLLYAAALLDVDVQWLPLPADATLCSAPARAAEVAEALEQGPLPLAVYLTSPDYLGQQAEIEAIAKVCHARGVLLLVDNAHGAYLRFLSPSHHPIDLGADLVCDSAHKTLPVLTGGAYLHLSKQAPKELLESAREHLALFGSTSPSYLILQSLDLCNRTLATDLPQRLAHTVERVRQTADTLLSLGYELLPAEPLKLVLRTRSYGYTGKEFAAALSAEAIEVEMADPEGVVLMLSTETSERDFLTLERACRKIPRQPSLPDLCLRPHPGERVLSLRRAILAPAEELDVQKALGRICATPSVSCPPAIPIALSGERIQREQIELFIAYDIRTVRVIKES